MRGTKLATIGAMAVAAIALAAPAQADYDTDFKNTVNGFGVYGAQDYVAWLGKISCNRMGNGVDPDAYKAADFVQKNLPRGTSQAQAFQFIGAEINFYCPQQAPVLQRAGH